MSNDVNFGIISSGVFFPFFFFFATPAIDQSKMNFAVDKLGATEKYFQCMWGQQKSQRPVQAQVILTAKA